MRRKVQTLGKLTLLSILLIAVAASAQDYKIRAKVDLVVVPVTVKGSGDKLITGLSLKDFVVLEDGRTQTVTNFTADPVPLSAAVVIDTGLSSGSLSKIQKTFPALAGAFSEFDEVAVYRYDKFVAKVLDFSQNAERIQTAMNTLRDLKPDATLLNLGRGPFSIPAPVSNCAALAPPAQVGVRTTNPPKARRLLEE